MVDSGGNAIGVVTVQENFSSLSTNTCRADGAGPSPDSCSSVEANGNFSDGITVNCNLVNGSADIPSRISGNGVLLAGRR